MSPKPFRDWYAILEVNHDATSLEVKEAYRKLALLRHPDKNVDDVENANAAMRDLNDAWEALRDSEKRRLYDKTHPDAVAALQTAVLPQASTSAKWGTQLGSTGIIKGLNMKVSSVRLEQGLKSYGKVKIVRGRGMVATAQVHFSSPATLQRACNGKPIVIDKDSIGDGGYVLRVEPASAFNIVDLNRRGVDLCPSMKTYIYNIPNHIRPQDMAMVLAKFGDILRIEPVNFDTCVSHQMRVFRVVMLMFGNSTD